MDDSDTEPPPPVICINSLPTPLGVVTNHQRTSGELLNMLPGPPPNGPLPSSLALDIRPEHPRYSGNHYGPTPQYVATQPSCTPPTSYANPGYSHTQQTQLNSAQQHPSITHRTSFSNLSAVPDPRTGYAPQRSPSPYSQDRPPVNQENNPVYSHTTSMSSILNPTSPGANSNYPQNTPGYHSLNTYPYNPPSSSQPPAISITQHVPRSLYQDTSMLSPPPLRHSTTYPLLYTPSSFSQERGVLSHQPSFSQLHPHSGLYSQNPGNSPSHNSTASPGQPEHMRPRANTIDNSQYLCPETRSSRNLEPGLRSLSLSDSRDEPSSQNFQHSPPQSIQTPNIFAHTEEPKIKKTTWDWIRDKFEGIHSKKARIGRGQFGKVYNVIPSFSFLTDF